MDAKIAYGLVLAIALAGLEAPSAVSPSAANGLARKRIIACGHDLMHVPMEAYERKAKEFADMGFDGIVVSIDGVWPDGGVEHRISDPLHGRAGEIRPVSLRKVDVSRARRIISKVTKEHGLGESMLRVGLTSKNRIDWKDDAAWAVAADNIGFLAGFARDTGLAGIQFDEEDYSKGRQFFAVKGDPPARELAALVRKRGRQVFATVFREFPDIRFGCSWLFSTIQKWHAWARPETGVDLMATAESYGELWCAFMNGALDAMPPGATIVEGNEERGYHGRADKNEFAIAAWRTSRGTLGLIAPENRRKFLSQLSVSFGQYADSYINPSSVEYYFPPLGGSRLKRWHENLQGAVNVADDYVWIYGEKGTFVDWERDLSKAPGVETQKCFYYKTWEEQLPGFSRMIKIVKGDFSPIDEDIRFGRMIRVGGLDSTWSRDKDVPKDRFVRNVKGGISKEGYAMQKGSGCFCSSIPVKPGDELFVRAFVKGRNPCISVSLLANGKYDNDRFGRPRTVLPPAGWNHDEWQELKYHLLVPDGATSASVTFGGSASPEAPNCFDCVDIYKSNADYRPFAERMDEAFAIGTPSNRIGAADCGLVNGFATFNGWIKSATEVRGFFSPPYYTSTFRLSLGVNGEQIPAQSHLWRPEELQRTGTNTEWRVISKLYPIAGERAGILVAEVENISGVPKDLHVACLVSGGVGSKMEWGFVKPGPPPPSEPSCSDGVAVLDGVADDAQIAVALPGGVREKTFAAVKPGERHAFTIPFAIGRKGEAAECAKRLATTPKTAISRSVTDWQRRVKRLCGRFPELDTDCAELEQLYCRSLLHLLLNEWRVPEFKLKPYYATGGMNGGCLCCYLWNFGEVYRLWPMLDPEAAKAHIRTFLRLDLSACYAFDPVRLEALGPYYPVNHEKVLLLAHAYVAETGDKAFLKEQIDGQSVIERLVRSALAHDDLSKDAVLVDYGNGNHHLELRKEFRYDGILPDMNLRRVVCFRLADELCRVAGYDPKVDLVARAGALKKLVRQELWDSKAGWFDNIDTSKGGRRDRRWTMQMFKVLGWGDWAIDGDVENALVRHVMDENEFLGPFGIHSLSKKDVAYDENDVDNGGPGACVSFAPAVIDRLYRSGRVKEAETIFKRLWWLGGALPYWGDSHYADRMDYRRDTPLQNDIQGAALAQTIIFGLFGIEPRLDGSIDVNPHLPEGVNHMNLRGVKLAGRNFDVLVDRVKGVKVLYHSLPPM